LAPSDQLHGTNIDATWEAGETDVDEGSAIEEDCPNINSGARCTSSVWFNFTASTTDTYTIETCDLGTDFDTVLEVWDGSALGSLTKVSANDDACIGDDTHHSSQVSFMATSGHVYHVELAGFDAAQGTFYIRAYQGSPSTSFPEPDTVVSRGFSFRDAKFGGGTSRSGPRENASFAFTSDMAGAAFQCSLDGAAFSVCSSPVSLDSVTSGTHRFVVRSVVSGIPDPTPADELFTIDHDPPETALATGPADPNANPVAEFRALSSERSFFDQYQCKLDAQPLSGCSSDRAFNGLCNAVHTFQTAARDPANNLDPTPTTASFTESGGGACAPPEFGSLTTETGGPTFRTLHIPVNLHGEAADEQIDYGTTTAYGTHVEFGLDPDNTNGDEQIGPLTPGTLYHYKVTLKTAAGTIDSGDQTFTTDALGVDVLPQISLGTPLVVGDHAVVIPVTVNPGKVAGSYGVAIDDHGPITEEMSPAIDGKDEIAANSGPVSRVVDIVDIDPGTYHLRAFAGQDGGNFDEVMTPETTFSIPAIPVVPPVSPPPLQPLQPFKFRRSFVKIGKIRRGAKSISLVISHLPPSTSVGVTVKATLKAHASTSLVKLLGRGKARAGKGGVARVKVKLGRKARAILRKRTKSLSLQVRVKPPGQSTTSITLHRKPRR
jgi:hypothetical protein